MLIDTHCHLQFPEFNADRTQIIGNAKKVGVKKIIVPGIDRQSSINAKRLSDTYPQVIFHSVGFHPYEAQHLPTEQELLHLMDASTIAIGECGLDYHLYKEHEAIGKKDNQKRLFAIHLSLAARKDLPVIMHCRNAFEDFFDVLDSMPQIPHGVIHCFSGGLQEIRMTSERGLYIGVDGNITYQKHLARIITQSPLSMILLETDAPYLTPIPFRGKKNEPKNVLYVAKYVSSLKGLPLEAIERVTTENATHLFRL